MAEGRDRKTAFQEPPWELKDGEPQEVWHSGGHTRGDDEGGQGEVEEAQKTENSSRYGSR